MTAEPLPVIRIQRTGKRRSISEQTQRDSARLNERIRHNAALFPLVEMTLDRVFKKQRRSELIDLAEKCAHVNGAVHPIDRIARRHRPGLICWFCENWSAISAYVLQHSGVTGLGSTPSDPPQAELTDQTQSAADPEK
jgi:hypothetical protein